jgi:hypothetical protein
MITNLEQWLVHRRVGVTLPLHIAGKFIWTRKYGSTYFVCLNCIINTFYLTKGTRVMGGIN